MSKQFVQNPPNKHHYIPAFYISRWRFEGDGRLVVYSKPYKDVIDRLKYPDATGYQEGLYALRTFEPALKNRVEERFFKPVDFQASEALVQLEHYGNRVNWNLDNRTAWTRFLLSLLLRCPEDLELLREYWAEESVASSAYAEARYEVIRKGEDPSTFRDYLLSRPTWEHESSLFNIFQNLIDNENIGSYINQMKWSVIDTRKSNLPLMTSDRPLIRTSALKATNGHLALPIGPYKLFKATHEERYLRDLLQTPARLLVKEVNRTVMQHAVKFGYANDTSQRKFVQSVFNTRHEPRLVEGILRKQRERKL